MLPTPPTTSPLDPSVQLALIAGVGALIISILGSATSIVLTLAGFKNVREQAEQKRAWDIADREQQHRAILGAVAKVETTAVNAFDVSNHINAKITAADDRIAIATERIEVLHQDLQNVLAVTETKKDKDVL